MNVFQSGGPMAVRTWLDHGRSVAEVSGEVDVYTAPELRVALADVQRRSERPHLMLLLEHLTFMDSTGLGLLVAAHKRAAIASGMVVLVDAPEFLGKVLRVTGLDAILPCFRDAAEAVSHLETSGERRVRARKRDQ